MKLALEWITAIAALLGAGSLVFVAQQLWFGAWINAQEIFVDEDFVTARGRVYSRIPNAPPLVNGNWTADDYLVCRKMDELARLARYLGFFGMGNRLILKVWCDPLAKSWIVLHTLVKEERKKTTGQPKWAAFEKLGKKATRRLGLREIPEDQLLEPGTTDKLTDTRNPGRS